MNILSFPILIFNYKILHFLFFFFHDFELHMLIAVKKVEKLIEKL